MARLPELRSTRWWINREKGATFKDRSWLPIFSSFTDTIIFFWKFGDGKRKSAHRGRSPVETWKPPQSTIQSLFYQSARFQRTLSFLTFRATFLFGDAFTSFSFLLFCPLCVHVSAHSWLRNPRGSCIPGPPLPLNWVALDKLISISQPHCSPKTIVKYRQEEHWPFRDSGCLYRIAGWDSK